MRKNAFISITCFTIIFLLFISAMNIIVDPYFHYHKPLDSIQYKINSQRYQNDGIVRHFSYDGIIIGSSMTENFKTSEFDDLFNLRSIKVPFSGASLKETNDCLQRAFSSNPNIKAVVRCVDYTNMLNHSEKISYDGLPTYLYDDDIINDVNYFLNGEVFIEGTLRDIFYTLGGGKTKTFDEYCNWMYCHTFGKEWVLKNYERPEVSNDIANYSIEDRTTQIDNIEKNIIKIAKDNPNTEFYIFLPPYSICYFDELYRKGELEKFFEMEKVTIENLVNIDNIRIFCFLDEFEMICDLNNYTDKMHYSEDINSYMLDCMSKDTHRVTKDTYQNYCNTVKNYYMNYDYNSIFN